MYKEDKIEFMHHNPVEVLKTNDWEKECRLAQIKHGIRNPLILTSNSILKPFNLSSVFHSESIFSDINPDRHLKAVKTLSTSLACQSLMEL